MKRITGALFSLFCTIIIAAGIIFFSSNFYFGGNRENSIEYHSRSEIDVTDNSSLVIEPETSIIEVCFSVEEFTVYPYTVLNKGRIYENTEKLKKGEIKLLPLDSLGRAVGACGLIGPENLCDEPRDDISSIKPSGFISTTYDFIEQKYLYNRCHLIGYQLSGLNGDEENLITGTRFLNITGMLPFENRIAKYIRNTGNHVFYRVTPVYSGENLVASGVIMEAKSDANDDFEFCIYCYNVQPGVEISYADGTSTEKEINYAVNLNTYKYHELNCDNIKDIAGKNKILYSGSEEYLISEGFAHCKECENK